MKNRRIKQAATELIQNQIILMLICVGLISLLLLIYGIFSDTARAPFIESALGLNALLAFLLGYLLPHKTGSVNRLYRLGLLRMDIFKTYLRTGGLYALNTVTLILFIGIFINLFPWLNRLNSNIEMDVLMIIISASLYTFGLYLTGAALRIALKTTPVYALIGLVLLVLLIWPLFGGSTSVIGIVAPLILIGISVFMLYRLLRAVKIERQI